MSKITDLLTIDAAAKKAHMNRARAKQLATAGGALVPWGKQFRVDWPAFERAVMSQRVEPQRQKPKRRPAPAGALHPLVRC